LKKKSSRTVYFAGERFGFEHLLGNAYLAEAIYEKSHGQYLCRLPQDSELHSLHPRVVRDHDLQVMLECDAALFSFDGAGPGSGPAGEFVFAKAADLPAVILRGDVRGAANPWSRMAGFWPRTATVPLGSLPDYRTLKNKIRPGRGGARLDEVVRLAGQHASATAAQLCDQVAAAVVRALDRVIAEDPVMPRHLREEVYNWLALMPGLRGKPRELRKEFERHLERKVKRGLL
jgi:hypothetical protein